MHQRSVSLLGVQLVLKYYLYLTTLHILSIESMLKPSKSFREHKPVCDVLFVWSGKSSPFRVLPEMEAALSLLTTPKNGPNTMEVATALQTICQAEVWKKYGAGLSPKVVGWNEDNLIKLPTELELKTNVFGAVVSSSLSPDSSPAFPRLDLTNWLFNQRSQIIVAHGRRRIGKTASLPGALVECLDRVRRRPEYVFFMSARLGISVTTRLSEDEIQNSFIFLAKAGIPIIIDEFQWDQALSSVIRRFQTNHGDVLEDFGMLLFGSHQNLVYQTGTKVFHSVKGIKVCHETNPVPEAPTSLLLSLYEHRSKSSACMDPKWLDTLLEHLSLVGPNMALIGFYNTEDQSNKNSIDLGSLLDDEHLEQIKVVGLSAKKEMKTNILDKLVGFGYLRKVPPINPKLTMVYRLANPTLFTFLKYGNNLISAQSKEPQGPTLEWLMRDALDVPLRTYLGVPLNFECFYGNCNECEVDGLYYHKSSKQIFLVSIKRSATKQDEQDVFYKPLLHLRNNTKVLNGCTDICLVCISAFGELRLSERSPSSFLQSASVSLSKIYPKLKKDYQAGAEALEKCTFTFKSIDVKDFLISYLQSERVSCCNFVGGKRVA